MERNYKTVIKHEKLISLIVINSELNFVFHRKNLGMDRGILLLLNEALSMNEFVHSLLDIVGAVEVKKLKYEVKDVWNYQLAIHKYRQSDKMEALQDYLDNTKFLPVVLVYGIVPEVLKGYGYIIKISETSVFNMKCSEFVEEINSMREFIRSNPEIIVRELDLVYTSEEDEQEQEHSPLFVSLLAALRVYCAFYRNVHSESDTMIVKAEMLDEIKRCVQLAKEMEEDDDSIDAIRSITLKYFEEDKDYKLTDVGKVDGNTMKAVKNGEVVLYDNEFYYISEPLFRKSCKPLLPVLSFIEIKKMLRDEGVLYCNEIENTNFTIKKVYVNVYGITCRERFLKVDKKFFSSRGGLYLEEWRDN